MKTKLQIAFFFIFLLVLPSSLAGQGLILSPGVYARSSGETLVLLGNWVNNGNYSNQNGTLIINGTTTISGSSVTTLGNLIINNAKSLTAPPTLQIANNLTNNGTLTSTLGTIAFVGSSPQTISGNSNTQFHHLSIANGTSVITGSNNMMRVSGNLTLQGTGVLDAGSFLNTIEFNGTDQVVVNPNGLTPGYYNLLLSGNGAKTMPATALSIIKDFSLSGTVMATAIGDIAAGGNLFIANGCNITISPAVCVNVTGNITNNANVSGLLIKSDSLKPNGSLIFHNEPELAVEATVEMYSKAYRDKELPFKYKWQFFGIPVQSMLASPTLDGSYVREMHEDDDPVHWEQLKNSSPMSAFKGYEITQANKRAVYFQGKLVNGDWTSAPLSYTTKPTTPFISYPGQHLIGNPYTAAISISKIEFDPGILNTVYLYNTGSYDDWLNKSADSLTISESNYTAGQYIAVPIKWAGIAGLQSQIPSMQAFLVRAKVNGARIKIPYNSNVMFKNTTKQRIQASKKIFTLISVKGKRYGDCMWIFSDPNCSHNFDNGWDGEKIMGSPLAPQLFAMEADGDYQVNSVNDINNTYLGFQAGEDLQDTLTFTHENLELRYDGLYLLDLAENKTLDITLSGTKYVFSTGISLAPIKRFKIITSPALADSSDVATGLRIFSSQGTVYVHNLSCESGYVLLYDMAGRMLQKLNFEASGVTSFPMNLTPGAYIAKALTGKEEITKRLVIPLNEK